MAHIKNRLRGLLVAFVALVAALAIAPGAAHALTNASTGDLTITGFEAGDTVTLYKVVDTTYNDDNTIEHTWNASVKDYMEGTAQLTIDQYLATADDADGEGATAGAIRAALNAAIEGGTAQGITTQNNNGTVTATGLAMGQYYVLVETAEGSLRTYQHMIVSVQPTPQEDGSTWDDPIQVTRVAQPKYTEQTTVEKEITSTEPAKGYLPGTQVQFTITTAIPSYALNTNWDETRFTITDTRTNLDAPADDAYVITVGEDTVVKDVDYTVSTVGNVTTITFSGDFLQNHQNEAVVVTYTATVAGDLDHSQPIENQVRVDPGNNAGTDEDTVTLELYKVTGKKVDSVTKNGLKGAVFSIYRDSNENGTYDAGTDALIDGGITSKDQGVFEYDPLAEGTYFLVETQAPAGYELLTGAVKFTTGDAAADNVITLTDVENTKDTGINLPQTGGAGTVALTAAGVVLVAGAAAFIVRSRKEN